MKVTILVMAGLCFTFSALCQTKIDKTIPVTAGQTITMKFDFPNMIRVSTWDKNEISIQGTVSINSGENDGAFKLQTSTTGKVVTIQNEITDMKNLPQRYTIYDGSQKVSFRSREDMQKYRDEKGLAHVQWMSTGVDMDIVLEIKVPRNTETTVNSVHGAVEINSFQGPLTVSCTHGLVDASLTEASTGELTAETNFGTIYTNLAAPFTNKNSPDENFHTYVSATPGKVPGIHSNPSTVMYTCARPSSTGQSFVV